MDLHEMEDALVAGLAAGYKACGMTKEQYDLFIGAFTAHMVAAETESRQGGKE